MSPPVHDAETMTSRTCVATSDGETDVETDFTLLVIDDLVEADFARPFARRLSAYLASFADHVASGTCWRFFSSNWRFALYFLYPFLGLATFGALGAAAAFLWLEMDLAGGAIAAMLLGAVVAGAAGVWLGRRYFVFHLMDLWAFSQQYVRRRRPDMEARLEAWRAHLRERIDGGDYDEILLVGHSTGGALILDLASRVAEAGSRPMTVLTVGSTSLKIALHPAAREFRQRMKDLAGHHQVKWFEYQALTDVINFYKCDPYAAAGLEHDRPDAFPAMQQVRFRHMLEAGYYRRMKRNYFRVHYQFISANTKRYFYDYFLICFGAARLDARFHGDVYSFAPDRSRVEVG